MPRVVLTRASQLQVGDAIHRIGQRIVYDPPRLVTASLAPLEPDHPVWGVRLAGRSGDAVEYVLYPAQIDGLRILVERCALAPATSPKGTRLPPAHSPGSRHHMSSSEV